MQRISTQWACRRKHYVPSSAYQQKISALSLLVRSANCDATFLLAQWFQGRAYLVEAPRPQPILVLRVKPYPVRKKEARGENFADDSCH